MAQEAFPLHFLVWNNQYLELDRELQRKEVSRGCSQLDDGGIFPFHPPTPQKNALDGSRCIALMLLSGFGSAAGYGAPGSEGAHPSGAGCVPGPPRVHQGASQTLLRPHTLQHTGLDQ